MLLNSNLLRPVLMRTTSLLPHKLKLSSYENKISASTQSADLLDFCTKFKIFSFFSTFSSTDQRGWYQLGNLRQAKGSLLYSHQDKTVKHNTESSNINIEYA